MAVLVPPIVIQIKDCLYKGEHPNPKALKPLGLDPQTSMDSGDTGTCAMTAMPRSGLIGRNTREIGLGTLPLSPFRVHVPK